MAAKLAEPIQATLFFAGEATDSDGEQGTVHGALTSGRRAARQMLEALAKAETQNGQASRKASWAETALLVIS